MIKKESSNLSFRTHSPFSKRLEDAKNNFPKYGKISGKHTRLMIHSRVLMPAAFHEKGMLSHKDDEAGNNHVLGACIKKGNDALFQD